MNRRDFVKSSVLATSTAAVAGVASFGGALGNESFPALTKKREIPTGTIAGVTFSRMMLGGNLIGHYTHSRDLRYVYNLAAHYNTPEKIYETMRIAEEHGINTLVIHFDRGVLKFLNEFKKRGGKMQCIMCPLAPVNEDMAEYTQQCQEAVDAGVETLYLWGVHSDELVEKRPEMIKKVVSTMKSFDVPVGIAAHELSVVEFCEREKIKNDFYLKTFHHRNYPSATLNYDSSWCDDPEKHIEVFSKVEKPWIAYKVMAAGAIPPKDALNYTFSNGADFVVFGMFDFEIDEDTRLLNEVLTQENVKNRQRQWCA